MEMSDVLFSGIVYLISVFFASVSQLLLKTSAKKTYSKKIYEYINCWVIGAYVVFGTTTLVGMLSLRYLPLSLATALEATGYIFVSVLSYIFLRETMNRKQILGIVLIVFGVGVFIY